MSRPNERGSARTTGLVVAIAVGLAAAGVLVLVVLRRTPRTTAPVSSSVAPPDIFSLGAGNSKDAIAGQGSGEGVRIELADRQNAARVAMVIMAKRIDPLEGRRYAVVEPSAYRFLTDGRVVHVRAKSGRFTWPSRDQAPEQGTFEGDVKATLYAAGFKPGDDPARATVIAEAWFDAPLDFDTTFGEASTPGVMHATNGTIMFTGEQVRVLFDEAHNGIQLFRAERNPTWTKWLAAGSPVSLSPESTPIAKAAGQDSPVSVTDDSRLPRTTSVAASANGTPDIETLYRAVYSKPLVFKAGTRRVDAQSGEGFVRLVNNALPPNALAEVSVKPAQSNKRPSSRAVDSPGEPAPLADGDASDQRSPEPTYVPKPDISSPTPSGAPVEPQRTAEWTLTSAGPLEIKPLPGPGAELVRNDVVVKLRGADEPVRWADSATHQRGHAPRVDYAATRGDLVVESDVADGAEHQDPTGGVIRFRQAGINLPTRVGQIRGAGELLAGSSTTPKGAAWKEQADFEFSRETADWKIKNVLIAGSAKAWDGASSVVGDVLRAELDASGEFKSAHVAGNALALDGKGGKVAGDAVGVAFKPGADGKSQPWVVTSTGHALASRDRDVLNGELIEATLGPGKDGKNTPIALLARGTVVFNGKDGVHAAADELRADIPGERVVLVGKSALAAKGATKVNGEVIKLSRATERIDVEGPGLFMHAGTAKGEAGGGVVAATSRWAERMSFDNASGILEAHGSTHSEIMPDDKTIDKIDGDFIRVELEPLAAKGPIKAGEAAISTQPDRRVLRAVAQTPAARPNPATVESRKYGSKVSLGNTGQAAVEQLVFLEGREILADLAVGTLDVPGRGRSVVLDRRGPEPAGIQSTATNPFGGSSRGTALFEWSGSMHYVRDTGDLSFLGGAKMTHAREADGSTMYLEAERIDAVVKGVEGASESVVRRGRLTKATGSGAVFSKLKSATGERQMTADGFMYDADMGKVRAWSDESAEIIVYNSTTASPVRAAEILWDLAKDRVEIVKPSTIVAPR